MHFKVLSAIGDNYGYEEGTQGHRAHASTFADAALGKELKEAIIDLRSLLRAPAPAPQQRGVAAQGLSVRQLANFHHAQAQTGQEAEIARLRAKITKLKAWLKLQGVDCDANGNVTTIEHRVVIYDHQAAAQGRTQIHFAGGRLFTDQACRTPLDTSNMVTHFSGVGKAIFVMSETGNLHVSSHVVGNRHHSSLLAGANVACGGEIEVRAGSIEWLSNKSGHYRPKIQHLLQVLHLLQKRNVPMTFALTVVPGGANHPTVRAFLERLDLDGEDDYELTKLFAYSAHLTETVLDRNNWRWRFPNEAPGVHDKTTNLLIPHKQVRKWLKQQGLTAAPEVQSGTGR
jgi:hypothetical protein